MRPERSFTQSPEPDAHSFTAFSALSENVLLAKFPVQENRKLDGVITRSTQGRSMRRLRWFAWLLRLAIYGWLNPLLVSWRE